MLVLPPPPQPVNHAPTPQRRSSSKILFSRARNKRRLETGNRSKPGSVNRAAHCTTRASPFRKGAESIRACAPVVSVNTVLAVVVLPENETEAGWKLQLVFCGSPVHENCSVPAYPEGTVMLKLSVTEPAVETVSDVLLGVKVSTGKDAEVDAAKLPSPAYCALSETSPVGNDDSVRFAVPPLSVAEPSDVCPAKNVTDPVGVPLLVDVAVAVRTMFWFESVKVVVVGAGEIVSVPLLAITE